MVIDLPVADDYTPREASMQRALGFLSAVWQLRRSKRQLCRAKRHLWQAKQYLWRANQYEY